MTLSRDRDPFSFQRLAVIRERLQTFLNRRGYEIVDVDYDIYEYKRVGKRKNPERVNTGRNRYTYNK